MAKKAYEYKAKPKPQTAGERIGNKIETRNKELESKVEMYMQKVVQLHRAFEMYFLGLERRIPDAERTEMKRELVNLRGNMQGVKTVNRYRFNTLWQRFTTYEQMWDRTLKQIEEGTYHRDVTKAKRRAKRAEDLRAKEAEESAAEPAAGDRASNARVAAEKAAQARSRGDLSDGQIKKIFDTYVMARQRTGESTNVSMNSLAGQLRERAKSMASKHNTDVGFKVVIKGGKALIKAQPKK